MIEALELTASEYNTKESDISALIGEQYQEKGVETVNDKLLLIKPVDQNVLDAISSLNIVWNSYDRSIIKVHEIG